MTTFLSSIPGIGYHFLTSDQQMKYDLEQCIQKAYVNGFPHTSEVERADGLVREARSQFSDKPQVLQACHQLAWLREVSRQSELMRAEKLSDGRYGLKILPKALDLPPHEFNVQFFKFIGQWDYPVIFESRVYTSKAVVVAMEHGKLSSPKEFVQSIEYTFREGKKSKWTAAQIKSLGLKLDIDLSEVEESLFVFAYETFVDGRHHDMAWWNQRNHEEVFRLRGFAARFMTERKVEVPEFTLGIDDAVVMGEDRLLLTPERFRQSMRDFLGAYPRCNFIRIEQSKEKYPLVFRRYLFHKLVEGQINPALIKKAYTIKTEEDLVTSVTFDVIYQVFSPGNFNAIPENCKMPCSQQTLEHAIQYVKTGVMPLTWQDQKKLSDLLNAFASGTMWTNNFHQTFYRLELHLSKTHLQSLGWKDLDGFLLSYLANESFTFHVGPYAYSIKTLRDLVAKLSTVSMTLLAQPVWFQVGDKKVQGDLSLLQFYPKVLENYPSKGTGELGHPIQFPASESLFNESNIKPFISSFRMLQSLRNFLLNFNPPKAFAFLDSKLQECSTVYIGDSAKKGKDYWNQVQEDLAKYPQASDVILEGSSQKWKRSVVAVFCEEGTLVIEDLNTAVLLKLSALNTPAGRYEPVYHQISLAEWICLSSSDPSIDRSGQSHPSNRILIQDFLEVYGQVFKTHEKKELSTDLHPFLQLLTPFALQKIDPRLIPPQRIFSIETSLFYAPRVLALFTAVIGGYLCAKSSSGRYAIGVSAVVSLGMLRMHPLICYLGGAAVLGYGLNFLFSKRVST
ncbi:MAG: hypothetical protein JSS10_03660 [Verrucomicrobia bacterium]|nr:hypothetical protein [Verrucomicrobiota bacterium]